MEPADWEICCGPAGVYNLLEPAAGEPGERKARNLLATALHPMGLLGISIEGRGGRDGRL